MGYRGAVSVAYQSGEIDSNCTHLWERAQKVAHRKEIAFFPSKQMRHQQLDLGGAEKTRGKEKKKKLSRTREYKRN